MKKIITLLIIGIFVFSLTGCGGSDEIIAVVNGEEISKERFETNLEQIKTAYEKQGASMEGMEEEVREQLLEELINQQILFQETEKRGIEVDQDEVEEEIEEIKADFESEEEFYDLLEFYGMSKETLRENITYDLLFNKLKEDMVNKDEIEVSKEELKERYEEEKRMFEEQQELIDSQIPEEMRGELDEEELEELEAQGEFEDFEELESSLMELIRSEKQQEIFYNIIQELREESEIERYL